MKDSQNKARQYAIKLLAYRSRSEKELKERLIRKGFPESIVSEEIGYLRKLGFVNDSSLAESLKHDASTRKFLSLNGTRRYLLEKGIPRNIVSEVCTYSEYEDLENAGRYVSRKIRLSESCPDEKTVRRLYNQLLRRGYSPDIISKALNEIKTPKED